MNFFLRAKHWQFFLLIWGAYFLGTIVLAASVPEGPVENILKVELFAEVVMSPSIVCLMGWLWSMGSFLVSMANPPLKLNIQGFRFAVLFPTLCLLTGLPFFLSRNPVAMQAIILPLHLFALGCLFYVFYFVSKSLLIAERHKAATFNDYGSSFFLLFFSLLGIWLIQPRINRLYIRSSA